MTSPRRFAVMLCVLLALGLVWGSTIVLTKVAVSTGHRPLGLIVWQLCFSSIALAAVAALSRNRLRLTRSHLEYFLVIALLNPPTLLG